jgi:diguanylate cyclase (GGDEF)-like protein
VLLLAVTAGALSGGLIVLALALAGQRNPVLYAVILAASVLSALTSLWVVETVLGRRIQRLVSFIEDRARRKRRTPSVVEQDDDLGRVIAVVDRLIAESAVQGRDSERSPSNSPSDAPLRLHPSSAISARLAALANVNPEQSQRELALSETLSTKTNELERRLRERALLFDMLRESTSSLQLEEVLERLTSRLGPALELREVAILLREPDGRFAIRSAWGFQDPSAVLGRTIQAGEGLTSSSVMHGDAVVIDDVAHAPNYLAFWGEVARTGSFMSIAIRVRDEIIGAITLTRPPGDPLGEVETRFVSALADQVALSIHNAQLYRRLEELSTHDELTKLPNRRYFSDRLMRDMADARRYGHPLSLLMIDVDHFKKLNDRCGHLVGDEALIVVANTLRKAVREVDTVARWGGEEFTVILSHAGEREAIEVAEKLRRAVAGLHASWSIDQPFGHISVSIGAAELLEGEDGASLIQRADRAVYSAKREGRNRVSGPLPTRASER